MLQQSEQDCVSSAESGGQGGGGNETLSNLSATQASIEGGTRALAAGNPTALGRAMTGTVPGMLAPTNAGYTDLGSVVQATLERSAPIIKAAGGVLAAGSVVAAGYQGYRSGGASGAATSAGYATADAYVEGAMVTGLDPLAGVPLSIAYDKLGGSRAALAAAKVAVAIQGCMAKSGNPVTNVPGY